MYLATMFRTKYKYHKRSLTVHFCVQVPQLRLKLLLRLKLRTRLRQPLLLKQQLNKALHNYVLELKTSISHLRLNFNENISIFYQKHSCFIKIDINTKPYYAFINIPYLEITTVLQLNKVLLNIF